MSINYELKDQNYSMLIMLGQSLKDNYKITNAEDYKKILKEHLYGFAQGLGSGFSQQEVDSVISDLISSEEYPLAGGDIISTESVRNDKWLEKSEHKFPYTDRFLEYLRTKKKNTKDITDTLKNDSFEIIQMLGNPKTENEIHRKGLMIGDIQSGKTGNYTAVLNRAVDLGYNVIVVLTGLTSSLRRQTQDRLDKELIGSRPKVGRLGVGLLSDYSSIIPATTYYLDFSSTSAKSYDLSLCNDKTICFISKKNVKVLEQIRSALLDTNKKNRYRNADDKEKLRGSILIIDDEADNASVNTNKPDQDPTAINKGIRDLLSIFQMSAYLAVTATPFANVFIDPNVDVTQTHGDDLFPSDFIFILDRPKAYTGAMKLFGNIPIPNHPDNKTYREQCFEPISDDEMENTYKFRHKKTVKVDSFYSLPKSMIKAVRYFVLVQALMDYLPDVSQHRTMMINVSRFVDVQNNIFEVIKEWIKKYLRPSVAKNCNYPERGDSATAGEYHELKLIWDDFNLNEISGLSWDEFSPHLITVEKLRVGLANASDLSKVKDNEIDYEARKTEGDRVIAVGGQCLSRGLTLEGLVVSYFYRNSVAYDTLLQMGRWFGYREKYIQYFKIWMSEESKDWYGMIAEASEDLRNQIDEMNTTPFNPTRYGLKVKYHPLSGLIVTARNKMLNTEQGNIRYPVDLRGRLIESPRLIDDHSVNQMNQNSIINFLSSIPSSKCKREFNGNNYVWKGVTKESIADFLANYKSGQLSIGFRIEELEDYVRNNSTDRWNVVIPQTKTGHLTYKMIDMGFDDIKLARLPRKYAKEKIVEGEGYYLTISGSKLRIGQGDITQFDLTEKEIKSIQDYYNVDKKWDDVKNVYSTFLKQYPGMSQRNSELILYPLYLRTLDDNKIEIDHYNLGDEIIWGIGLGFAATDTEDKDSDYFNYILNPVAMRAANNISDDDEEEDDISDDEE